MAYSYLQLLYVGPLAPVEVMPKAESAARKALELNELLPKAHAVLGAIDHRYHWDWEAGEREIRRAIELNPGFAPAHEMLIGVLVRAGRFDDALAEAQQALDLDPLSLQALLNRARVYRASGNGARASAEYRYALRSAAERSRARFQLGVTQILAGSLTEGIRDLEQAVTMSMQNPRMLAYLGYAYAAAGKQQQARRILQQLSARAEREYVSAFGRSLIHDALGEREPALSGLEQAYREHAVEFSQLDTYPPFRTLVSEPRFHALMQRVGAPAMTVGRLHVQS
jgi:tetratricopeptide (TPR) repeat protein